MLAKKPSSEISFFFEKNKSRYLIICSIICFFCLVFSYCPGIDISVSKIFFNSHEKKFMHNVFLDRVSPVYNIWVLNLIPLFFIRRFSVKVIVLFLACYILVHALFVPLTKTFWNRPRPVQIRVFNGRLLFTSPLQINKEIGGNSFVSGHAAGGFSLMFYSLLGLQRVFWWRLGILSGCGIGFMRILQGAHFLSDIIGAFLGVSIILEFMICVEFFYKDKPVKLL